MRIKELLSRTPETVEEQKEESKVRTPHERAVEEIYRWGEGARTLYFCEACKRVFVSFDVLYDHLWASEEWDPDDESRFDHYRKLTPGDGIPAASEIGDIEPCEATYL